MAACDVLDCARLARPEKDGSALCGKHRAERDRSTQTAACIESTCRNYGQPIPGRFQVTSRCHRSHAVIKCRCGTDFVRCAANHHD